MTTLRTPNVSDLRTLTARSTPRSTWDQMMVGKIKDEAGALVSSAGRSAWRAGTSGEGSAFWAFVDAEDPPSGFLRFPCWPAPPPAPSTGTSAVALVGAAAGTAGAAASAAAPGAASAAAALATGQVRQSCPGLPHTLQPRVLRLPPPPPPVEELDVAEESEDVLSWLKCVDTCSSAVWPEAVKERCAKHQPVERAPGTRPRWADRGHGRAQTVSG